MARSEEVLLGLWKHECNRVISDRFTNEKDKDWFDKTMMKVARRILSIMSINNVTNKAFHSSEDKIFGTE